MEFTYTQPCVDAMDECATCLFEDIPSGRVCVSPVPAVVPLWQNCLLIDTLLEEMIRIRTIPELFVVQCQTRSRGQKLQDIQEKAGYTSLYVESTAFPFHFYFSHPAKVSILKIHTKVFHPPPLHTSRYIETQTEVILFLPVLSTVYEMFKDMIV